MEKICWVTGDYFLDVDIRLVPYLQQKIDIEWIIIKTDSTKIEIEDYLKHYADILALKNRNSSIKIIRDFVFLIHRINKKKPGILYIDFFGMPFFYPLLYWLLNKNINIIHAAHNIIPYDGWPNKQAMTWYVNFIIGGRANLHIFSEHLTKYLEVRSPNKKYFYTPLTIKDYGEVKTEKFNFDLNKLKILFFGNIKNNKRLDLAISALQRLPDDIAKKIQLIVAGCCDNEQYYFKLINNHTSVVTFFERIPDNYVPELFNKVDFLILPYENVAQSGPLMIAFNYNLPVIASDIDGFKEHIFHGINGLLFENRNEMSLANVLKEAVTMSQITYEGMKKEMRKQARDKYSLAAVSSKYLNFFKMIEHDN